MKYRLLIIFMIVGIVCSGTALASFGSPLGSPDTSMPVLGSDVGYANATYADTQWMAAYSLQPPPSQEEGVFTSYGASNTQPSYVYYSGAYLPWDRYLGSRSTNVPSLWIETSQGWSWYSTAPAGTWVREAVYLPMAGPVKVYEIYPSGLTRFYSFDSAPQGYSFLWFYADTPGRHTSIITVDGVPTNAVMIDVTGADAAGYGSGYGAQTAAQTSTQSGYGAQTAMQSGYGPGYGAQTGAQVGAQSGYGQGYGAVSTTAPAATGACKPGYSVGVGMRPGHSLRTYPRPGYSVGVGQKTGYSVGLGPRTNSFSVGPKPAYSFRAGYDVAAPVQPVCPPAQMSPPVYYPDAQTAYAANPASIQPPTQPASQPATTVVPGYGTGMIPTGPRAATTGSSAAAWLDQMGDLMARSR